MSALPPKAEVFGRYEKGPLMTQSGHWGVYGIVRVSGLYFLRTNRKSPRPRGKFMLSSRSALAPLY